ncbi:MAG: isopenicillin N synthase family dioxygenase [Actinomadura sp.]
MRTSDVRLPVIDVAPLSDGGAAATARVAGQIEAACRAYGFFYVTGHGIALDLLERLSAASRRFFALPLEAKLEIAMAHAGAAWRGFFPVGAELTSGRPDRKLRGVALSLGLPAEYFAAGYTSDPTILFRVFHYPPSATAGDWGVGEHTDYGLLTLLAQDDNGGLQVRTPHGWIDAPPVPGTLVCNIGDMLDRLTGGWYRSTPHRVHNSSGRDRLSFPFFFDPGFTAEVPPLPRRAAVDDADRPRWDGQDLRAFTGTYGDYLLGKVAKVFPHLRDQTMR